MGIRFLVVLMLAAVILEEASIGLALTNDIDASALQALRDSTWQNTPPNWVGSDPCGDHWDGIGCTNSHVTSITLSTMGLTGQLSGDLLSLSELQTLDLSYNKGLKGSLPSDIGDLKKLSNLILVGCGFSGIIPTSIGSLSELVFLSLNSNGFSGSIPGSIGNLSKLYWLDLADNQLSGPIPVSSGITPGLDMLLQTKHFHFGQNQLTGTIPPKLFSPDMKLIHLLFDNNQLSGNIPSTLGLVHTLEIVRFDRNLLNGQIPGSLDNLTKLHDLLLSNNRFTGLLPNLTSLSTLSYLDMSNNSFDVANFPSWIPTLESLTTLKLEHAQVGGRVPASLFNLANLQTVILKDNQLNDSLSFGSSISNQLQFVDMQINNIDDYIPPTDNTDFQISLAGNPVCLESGASSLIYCQVIQDNTSSATYQTPANNCIPPGSCTANQTSSSNCKCASPYTGTLIFRAPSFSDLSNTTYYDTLSQSIMTSFQSHKLPVDSVSLSNPHKDSLDYLEINLAIFPSEGDSFNRTGILSIGFVLSNQTYKPPPQFGPFYFIGHEYRYFSGEVTAVQKASNSVSVGVIAGAAAGGFVLLLVLAFAGMYAYRQKRRADKTSEHSNLFGSWNSSKTSGSAPQLKGARWFSLEELKKCTKDFSKEIGSGGYGKVYSGMLPATGQLIAVKRAQQGSMQGGGEFKNEIELLSRVHHKNLVGLIGFCFEHGEQILVYEFIPNGSLKESLSGKTGIRLDWPRRLRIALGTARGLQYLHELANPPIIHRDVKSNNILLDEKLNAKVADFGLSKLMGDDEKGHVTTQVKGTMGYLDPEYYMTQQLTEKSDVYSFGVVLLELITARRPLEHGKYIVREVKNAMIVSKEMYGLHEVIDPNLLSGTLLRGVEKYIDLAMSCVSEFGTDRPTMGDAAKQIENVMQIAGLNPNAESASASASASASYEESSRGDVKHPYSNESFGDFSGGYLPSKIEPH